MYIVSSNTNLALGFKKGQKQSYIFLWNFGQSRAKVHVSIVSLYSDGMAIKGVSNDMHGFCGGIILSHV
jgi:hypothetical protein